jgi:hypothetical protein
MVPSMRRRSLISKRIRVRRERALTWFYSFPLWMDLGFTRVVHAAWSPAAMRTLKPLYLTQEILVPASTKGTPEYRAVETLLKGVEATLPPGLSFFDKDERERTQIRVRWWLKPDTERSVGGEFAGQVEATRANPFLSRIGRLVGSASTLK